MSIKIYSFDVFETALLRRFAYPKDLFVVLARQLLLVQGIADHELALELAQSRITAEAKVQQATEREDISIAQIYQQFSEELKIWKLSVEEALAQELQLELKSVASVWRIKSQVEQIRQNGQQIIFISDMYLPEFWIRKMLEACELAMPEDPIYVSGEIGLTKRSGRLFQYVLDKHQIQPSELQHIGDHWYGDFWMPRKLGIRAQLFSGSQLNQYELQTLRESSADPEVISRLVGISRTVRLSAPDEFFQGELSNLVANAIAPLLTSFVLWVIREALQQGVKRLYFVARDGQILWKIAQQLGNSIAIPECRYLYGSRLAWFLPAITECNQQSLGWLLEGQSASTIVHLLAKLGVVAEEIAEILRAKGFEEIAWTKPLQPGQSSAFWQVIEHPDVSARILDYCADLRQNALAYFAQEGLLSSEPWAIVDIGWSLRCQGALKKMLMLAGYQGEVKGYYLALQTQRLKQQEAGMYRAFLLEEHERYKSSSVLKYLFGSMLLEQVFVMADHGTTLRYARENETWVPVLKIPDSEKSDLTQEFVTGLHRITLYYVDEFAKTELMTAPIEPLKRDGLQRAIRFLSNPTSQEAELVAWIPIVLNHADRTSQILPLAQPLTIQDFIYVIERLFNQIFNPTKQYFPRFCWFPGSWAISNPFMKLLFLLFKKMQTLRRNDISGILKRWFYGIFGGTG